MASFCDSPNTHKRRIFRIKKVQVENERTQNLIQVSSSQKDKFCYSGDDTISDDLEMIIEKLDIVKRTDPNAQLVQTFFTPEEKKLFSDACGDLKMSHVLRCLALQYALNKQRESKSE